MRRLTDEQIDERLRVLAGSCSIREAAARLGATYTSLQSWVRYHDLHGQLADHRRRIRTARSLSAQGLSWLEVGAVLGVSARWAEHLAGLYPQPREERAA